MNGKKRGGRRLVKILGGLLLFGVLAAFLLMMAVFWMERHLPPEGDAEAILILGANHLVEEREIPQSRILGIFPRKPKKVLVDAKSELAEKLMYIRPSILNDCIISRLEDMEVVDFFVITTSLSEANILKPTKEVER